MNIDFLREFLDLAETLSFTKSSGNLNMSQSTLSRHIAELERQVGAKLLDRTTTSASLTEAGREFFEKATIMLRDFDGLLDVSRSADSRQPSFLRVGGYTTLPLTMKFFGIMNTLASAREESFRLRFHRPRSLTNDPPAPHPLDMLLSGDVDLVMEAAAFDAPMPQGCRGMRICDEPLDIVVSARSPLAGRHSVSLEELAGTRAVSFVVYRDCMDLELAPLRAAGMDVRNAKPIYVRDLLEIPERAAAMSETEVAPLERSFCELFGMAGGTGTSVLAVDDELMRFSYWLLCREDERRPGVEAAMQLADAIVSSAKAARGQEVNASVNLWSYAI